MRRVRILEQAAVEAIEAAAWYESERPGLGREFDHAVNAAIDLLEDEIVPLTNLPSAAGAKRLLLKRFPYVQANRRCAALSRSVQRPKGARLSAGLELTIPPRP